MARPHKEGLDFYYTDVNIEEDDKVYYIHSKYGIAGKACYVFLLCRVYKNGYFYPWTEREQIIFANKQSLDVNVCINIVNDCLNEGLFSSEIYDKYKVLTSKGVQKRYVEACERRKQMRLIAEYLLINPTDFQSDYQKDHQKTVIVTLKDINVCNNLVNVDINDGKCNIDVDIENTSCKHQEELTPVNDVLSTQKKRKEKKGKEKKEGDTPLTPQPPPDLSYLTKEEADFLTVISKVKGYKLDRKTDIDLFKALAEEFPKVDIVATAKEWATSKLDFPLNEKSKPRVQIRKFVVNNNAWKKNLRKEGTYGEAGHQGLGGENDPYKKGHFQYQEGEDYSDEGMF